MLSLIVNITIIILIVALAGYEIINLIKKSRQGRYAACDYACATKKMLAKKRRS